MPDTLPAMSRYDALISRARDGEFILIDGATGSECIRRGVPDDELGWSGGAALSHPDVVSAVHADYLAVGADLIVANTFATGRNILRDVGADASFESLNRRAVELAVGERSAAIAAGVSGATDTVVGAGISNWSFSGDHPALEQLFADTVAQATIMRDAGAEFLSLEMMVDLPRFETTLAAASSVGLPIWVGFTVGPEEGLDPQVLPDEIELRDGGRLRDGVEIARDAEVDAVCVMHTDVRIAALCTAFVGRLWEGPLGTYAHAAGMVDGKLVHHDTITPQDYAVHVPAWIDAGATMVGGCCGIGPDHLRLVADALGRDSGTVTRA